MDFVPTLLRTLDSVGGFAEIFFQKISAYCMAFLQKLRGRPEEERKKILFGISSLIGIILVFLFIFNIKAKFSNLKFSPENSDTANSLKSNFNVLKNSFGQLKELGAKGVEGLKELNKNIEQLKENK